MTNAHPPQSPFLKGGGSIPGLANPWRLVANLIQQRELLWQLTQRDIQGRYRGSYLSLLWTLLTPLLTLLVYTVVFSVILNAGWRETGSPTHSDVALTIFTGMIAFNVFGECALRGPNLIVNHRSLVKRVVFPLEILPVSAVGTALVHSLISLTVVLVVSALTRGRVPSTLVYLPLVYLPLAAFSLGTAWFLASLGVFVRDIDNAVGVIVQALFFLTPIVYPITAVPESLRPLWRVSPLATTVDGFQRVVLLGHPLDWGSLTVVTLLSGALMVGGYAWFMKTKGAFADVL